MERVVVTGASAGIGAACVELFKSEGAEVIGVDVQDASRADVHYRLDLAAPDCGQLLRSRLGDLEVHGLVNNAALQLNKAATETSPDDFDRLYEVNLRAPFLLASALRPMLKARRGFVVNVASVHALATSSLISAYAATKGGLVALTRALAVEWAPEIRVNAVLPGAVNTRMLLDGLERNNFTLDSISSRHPVGRVGSVDEVAGAILFLARNEFMTGSLLTVDGGATAHLSTE